MDDLRISAKTLDEAITKACVELGVTSADLDYEVIEQGSTGFLGIIGAKPCEIRARAKRISGAELLEELKGEVVELGGVSEDAGQESVKEQPGEKAKERKIKDKYKEKDKAKDKSRDKEKDKDFKKSEKSSVKAAKKAEKSAADDRQSAAQSGKQGKSAGKDRPQKSGSRKDEKSKSQRRDDEKGRSSASKKEREFRPVVLTEDPGERAKDFLMGIFSKMGLLCDLSTEYHEENAELIVNLSGEDMGVLIGRRGQTLDALQYLTAQVVNKYQNGYIRVKLDTENYRERRRENLEAFALNTAAKVRKNNRPMVLEPMNAYERRIIHSVLQSEEGVTTRSEGEEPYRHVVISPVRKKNQD